MLYLQQAISGSPRYGFRDERPPDLPAAVPGAGSTLCGASDEHVVVRRWGVDGPDVGACASCRAENALVRRELLVAAARS